VAAQGSLAHRDRHLANQVDAVTLKERMFSNADQAIKIAAGSATVAGFSLAAQANPSAGVHAGRHAQVQSPFDHHAAIAVASGTRIGDNDAAATAAAASLLHAEEALTLDDYTPPLTATT